MKILNLDSHHLVIIDQGRLLLLINLDLLNKVFGRSSFTIVLAHGTSCSLHHSQTLVRLNQLPLSIDNHGLKLVSLPEELLCIAVDLLLQVEVLAQKGIPLALAGAFATLVLLEESTQLANLHRLRLQDAREVV